MLLEQVALDERERLVRLVLSSVSSVFIFLQHLGDPTFSRGEVEIESLGSFQDSVPAVAWHISLGLLRRGVERESLLAKICCQGTHCAEHQASVGDGE